MKIRYDISVNCSRNLQTVGIMWILDSNTGFERLRILTFAHLHDASTVTFITVLVLVIEPSPNGH